MISLDQLPLDWVRAFEAAGRLGSFSSAARHLGITQAAISQRIGKLEARTGRQLFLRGARGISLSVEGEAWLPPVTAALQGLNDSFQEIFGSERRSLTIAASASVIELWLLPRLALWPADKRPNLTFVTRVLRQHSTATLQVEYGSEARSGHHGCPLFVEQLCPVAAPSLLNSGDWRDLPRIAVSGPRAGWQDWARFSAEAAPAQPVLRFDSMVTALAAAEAGQGVVLASLPLCAQRLATGRLARASKMVLEPPSTYWLYASGDELGLLAWQAICARLTADLGP